MSLVYACKSGRMCRNGCKVGPALDDEMVVDVEADSDGDDFGREVARTGSL